MSPVLQSICLGVTVYVMLILYNVRGIKKGFVMRGGETMDDERRKQGNLAVAEETTVHLIFVWGQRHGMATAKSTCLGPMLTPFLMGLITFYLRLRR